MIIGSSKVFEFNSVDFDTKTLTAQMRYSCGEHSFCEQVQFDVENPKNLDTEGLSRALKLMHLVSGISYYKAFTREVLEFRVDYDIPPDVAEFLNHIYEEGLGEFYYTNKLPPILTSRFEGTSSISSTAGDISVSGYSVGLGGGKDSLVAISLLLELGEIVQTYGVNAESLLSAQAQRFSTKHHGITRKFDIETMRSLKTDDGSGIYSGHVPISAILGSIGLVGGILSGTAKIVVAVERSANEPTREYQGKMINHQYSKTTDFEKSFDTIVSNWVDEACGYFSILRPLRELDIMKLFFAMKLQDKFAGEYSSCNKAIGFTLGRKPGDSLWCSKCDKCAFIYLLMIGAGKYDYAIKLFGGDLFGKESLHDTFEAVLGNTHTKPFDCVGEISESRESMDQAKKHSKYAQNFHYAPADIHPAIWSEEHNIPSELSDRIKELIFTKLGTGK